MVTSVRDIRVTLRGQDYEYHEFTGLSTDVKPIEMVFNGSKFLEMDTSTEYRFDGSLETWRKQISKSGNSAEVYNDYNAAVTAINEWEMNHRDIGDNVYIRALDVPDLWVSGVEETSVPYTYTTDAAIVSALKTDGYVQFGHYKLSALETQKVDIPDVQINGASIVQGGVANIPVGADGALGVVKIQGSGLNINSSTGAVSISAASNSTIENKSSAYQPVVPTNLDKAIMEGLGNNALAWSDAYKQSARNTIGAPAASDVLSKLALSCAMADGTTKTLTINGALT